MNKPKVFLNDFSLLHRIFSVAGRPCSHLQAFQGSICIVRYRYRPYMCKFRIQCKSFMAADGVQCRQLSWPIPAFSFFHLLLFLRFSYHGNHNWSIKSNHVARRLACRNRSKCKMLLKSHQLFSRTPAVSLTKVKLWNKTENSVDPCRAHGRFIEKQLWHITSLQNLRSVKRLLPGKMRPALVRFYRSNKINGVIRMGRTSMNGRVISREQGSMFNPNVSDW